MKYSLRKSTDDQIYTDNVRTPKEAHSNSGKDPEKQITQVKTIFHPLFLEIEPELWFNVIETIFELHGIFQNVFSSHNEENLYEILKTHQDVQSITCRKITKNLRNFNWETKSRASYIGKLFHLNLLNMSSELSLKISRIDS